jgi:hypothetical protein
MRMLAPFSSASGVPAASPQRSDDLRAWASHGVRYGSTA